MAPPGVIGRVSFPSPRASARDLRRPTWSSAHVAKMLAVDRVDLHLAPREVRQKWSGTSACRRRSDTRQVRSRGSDSCSGASTHMSLIVPTTAPSPHEPGHAAADHAGGHAEGFGLAHGNDLGVAVPVEVSGSVASAEPRRPDRCPSTYAVAGGVIGVAVWPVPRGRPFPSPDRCAGAPPSFSGEATVISPRPCFSLKVLQLGPGRAPGSGRGCRPSFSER